MYDLELLKKISSADGISSCEFEVSEIIKEEYDKLNINTYNDGIGSLIGIKCANNLGPKLMIAAHMDEVGFMVKDIDNQGFIKVQAIGSWWTHLVIGQWYTITTSKRLKYPALMGSMATHGLSMDLKNKTVSFDQLALDLGVKNKLEVESLGIRIGDMITPRSNFQIMNNSKYISSKALDDRIGNYIMIEVAKRLIDLEHIPLFLANTVQEEPGLRGARTATHTLACDIAFAIDTTLAGDTPFNENICKLGNGVVLSMIDSNSIAPRKLVKYVENICKSNRIKYQYAIFNKGGTDSGNIHKSFNGIYNMTLSIPIRYMHTHNSVINLEDVNNCIDLLVALVKNLDEKAIKQFAM